ncbi:WD40 repeat domain-containing protein, partial [Streptomyces sp. NPDC002187]|uniref:WD40 repeat domain-containing protein n=1 Tax=Streptomyces sp. NPDC002187 TaxID=3364637 RepID=UPI00367D95BD
DFHAWLNRVGEQQTRFAKDHHPGDLLDGTDLAEGLTWSQQRGLPHDIAAFLAASRRRQQAAVHRTRRINATLACILTLALIAAGMFLWQRKDALDQARKSAARSMVSRAETLRAGDPRLALQLGAAAYRLDPDSAATRASLLETLTTSGHTATLDGLGAESTALAISPDGGMLAAGGGDGSVRFWDISRPERPTALKRFAGSSDGAVTALAWQPDGRILAAGDTRRVILWNTSSRRSPQKLGSMPGFGAAITSAVWAADGHRLAVANYHNSYLLDLDIDPRKPLVGTVEAKIPHGGDPSDTTSRLALSADGDLLVTSDGKHSVQLWDATGRTPRKAGAPLPLPDGLGSVTSVALSSDDRTLALGTVAGQFALWNVADPRRPKRLQSTLSSGYIGIFGSVTKVGFTRDDVLACASDDGIVQLVQLNTVPTQRTDMPLVHGAPLKAMSVDAAHGLLATGGVDGRVLLWNTADRDRPRHLGTPLAGHATGSTGGNLTAGGTLLASSATDGKTLLWDVGRLSRPLPRGPVVHRTPGLPDQWARSALGSALSPDGGLLATVGGTRLTDVALWSTKDAKARRQGRLLTGHQGVPQAYAWSRDGSLLATGDFTGKVLLWDTSNPERVVRRAELTHPAGLRMVAFTQTARTLTTAGTDGKVMFWTLPPGSGRPVRVGSMDTGQIGSDRSSIALSFDGTMLAIGHSAAALSLWDISDPRRPRRLSHTGVNHNGPVSSLAFSPDGSLLASGSAWGAVLLWDITDPGQPRRTGPALYGEIPMPVAMTFLPDGRTLASQTITQVDLWDLSPVLSARTDVLPLACDRLAGTGLTPSAWNRYAGETEYRKTCSRS